MIIRHPITEEAAAICALFADEVRAGRMLPRTQEEIAAHPDDWLVAEKNGQVVGCVSLVDYSRTLCEIRSLAVDPAYRGNGIASRLVSAGLDLACERGTSTVLVLTRAAHLFETLGFRYDSVTNFPEKVWRDCAPCPFRHACDEVALTYHCGGR
ncbi:MAG: GNAT family N-acetyltransferase [Chloroflexi bacterium]|nr:GNAT family N-acetyltransferase [Chloroflexota bacterium]